MLDTHVHDILWAIEAVLKRYEPTLSTPTYFGRESMRAVILAGGGGTRLWPLSRAEMPKQFIQLNTERSLFQDTLHRMNKPDYIDGIFIVSNLAHQALLLAQMLEIGFSLANNVLYEPLPRSTAPAIALAAKFIESTHAVDPNDVLLVLPSDHVIADEPTLWQDFDLARHLAQQGKMVIFGIRPTRPETGYGYIHVDTASGKAVDDSYFHVQAFTEKPDKETAAQFVANGDYFWNSGMFAFTLNTLYQAFQTHTPDIYDLLQKPYAQMLESFHQMPNVSFDYAVMEHVTNVAMVPLSVAWSDVGCWDSLDDLFPKDAQGNIQRGTDLVSPDASNTTVFSTSGRTVSTLGLSDLIIVDTDDVLLVMQKGTSQDVRQLASLMDVRPSARPQPTEENQDDERRISEDAALNPLLLNANVSSKGDRVRSDAVNREP